MIGRYVLTAEDLLSSHPFPDTVALGGYPIDIHNPTGPNTATVKLQPGQFYYLPLRCLMVLDVKNLLTAGRCISVTHEAGAAVRVSPIAMALGQAAGAAAAICVADGASVWDVDYNRVRNALLKLGAILD